MLDGAHPEIKEAAYRLNPAAKEKTRANFITRRGSRPPKVSHRTGAKVGPKGTPKVLAKTKTEQKNSGKEPSIEEEQVKKAALRKEAVYKQKIVAWKQSVRAKANDAKAEEEAAIKKAAYEEATRMGPLQTQEIRPSDQVCHQDLETRPTTEPNKEPPHGHNDDLRGRELQVKLEDLLKEEELYNALDNDNSSPGKEVEANEVRVEPPVETSSANEEWGDYIRKKKPIVPTRKFLEEIREEEEHEESAESKKTAAEEAKRRATEKAAMVKAALEAALEKTPLVISALRRAPQAKTGWETAKDEPKAAAELRAIPEPLNRASELSHQDEYPGRSLESSSLVAEVAEELQYQQLPWEQPQQGLADDRADMPIKHSDLNLYEQGFPTLLPYYRYKDTKHHENLQVDDVRLIKYESKVASTYRLCRVSKLLPSDDGHVRTVEVQLGNKKPTNKNQPGKDLVTAVQRLVLLLPADELEQGPPEPREQPHQVGLAEVLPRRV